MSIEQKLLTKLQPHADRIATGSSNDFDYLPAVLLHVVEGQKQQVQAVADAAVTVTRKLDETEVSISSVKATVEQVAAQSRRQMEMDLVATNEKIDAISLQLNAAAQKSIAMEAAAGASTASFQKAHRKSHRLLILTLVSIAISICLAVVVALRH